MDKLEPVLKHKFWICFGIAILMLMIGWKMGSGALATTYEERSSTLDTAFNNATLGGQASSKPNQSWIAKAKSYNEQDQAEFQQSAMKLWKRQVDGDDMAGDTGEPVRFWPRGMQDRMKGIPYRGSVPVTTHREIYARRYQSHVMEQLEVVTPFNFETGEGLVVIDETRIPHVTFGIWKNRPPSWTDMWNAQEDVWLTRALLETVARVNEGATRIDKAPIREIVQIYLRGGERAEGDDVSTSGSGASADAESGLDKGGFGGMGAFGDGVGSAGPASNSFTSTFYYSDAEEFGVDKNAPASGLGGFGGMGGFGSMGMKGSADPAMSEGGSSSSSDDTKDSLDDRYVDKEETLPYVTRAFRLHVKMEQDAVPILLAELTNSNWPIEIVRVHMRSIDAGGSSLGDSGYGGSYGGDAFGGSEMGDDMDDGAMSSGGMGSGMGRGMMGGPMMGSGGMGGSKGGGMPSSGGMAGGRGMMGSGMMGSGMMGGPSGSSIGAVGSAPNPKANLVNTAMNDPFMVEVLVSGLMTLYRSPEEADAAEKTEQQDAAEEAANPAPPVETTGDTTTDQTDMQPDGSLPDDGSDPADDSDPAATTPTDPATGEETVPGSGTPDGSTTETNPDTGTGIPNPGTIPAGDPSDGTGPPNTGTEESPGTTP